MTTELTQTEERPDDDWSLSDAVADFLGRGFVEGDLIPYAYFDALLALDRVDDGEQRAWTRLSRMERLKEALLVDEKIALETVRGKGMLFVPAREQTSWAYGRLMSELKASFRRADRRLVNVRMDALDDRARRENADALARLGQIELMTRRLSDATTKGEAA